MPPKKEKAEKMEKKKDDEKKDKKPRAKRGSKKTPLAKVMGTKAAVQDPSN